MTSFELGAAGQVAARQRWQSPRQAIAAVYDAALKRILRPVRAKVQGTCSINTLCVPQREIGYRHHFGSEASPAIIHYPAPVHEHPAFHGSAHLGPQCRETERVCRNISSIPVSPELTDDQTALVSKA